MSTNHRARIGALRALLVSIALAGPAALGVRTVLGADFDFVRGDVNHDGALTLADLTTLNRFFGSAGVTPDCLNTADVDDDGDVDRDDFAALFQHLVCSSAPPAPFPAPGQDPTPNEDPDVDCDFYGGAEAPVEMLVARVELRDVLAPGGSEDRVVLTAAIHHSEPVSAYAATVAIDPAIVAGVRRDIGAHLSYRQACLNPDGIGFAVRSGDRPYAAGTEELRISLCLRGGTPAGEYPLEAALGELIDASGHRIVVTDLAGGTLTLLSDVVDSGECSSETPSTPPQPLSQIDATYRLDDTIVAPAQAAAVPFHVGTETSDPRNGSAYVEGYSFSIDYDESILEATAVEKVWWPLALTSAAYEHFDLDATRAVEGPTVEEGFVAGVVVFSFSDAIGIPVGSEVEALRLHFAPRDGVEDVSTELRFVDGARGSAAQFTNRVSAADGAGNSQSIDADSPGALVLIGGTVKILSVLPDVAVFTRGDANGDTALDVSDAMRTLEFLFLGGAALDCFDAADANDDGAIDIADPSATLGYLFLGHRALPPPSGAPGSDPTPDTLHCARSSGAP